MYFKFIAITSLNQSKWELPFSYQKLEKFGRAILLLLRERGFKFHGATFESNWFLRFYLLSQ